MRAIEWIAEQRILEAIEQGKLDNLPGRGKPLELEEDGHLPAEVRLAYKILRDAGFVPPVIGLRKEIEEEIEALRQYVTLVERYAWQYRREMALSTADPESERGSSFLASLLGRRSFPSTRLRNPDEIRTAYETLRLRAREVVRDRVSHINRRIRALHDEWLRETYRRQLAGTVDLTRHKVSEGEFLADLDRRVPPLERLS